jgi:LytS/YehU family sensor histidine kinase
MRFSENTFIPLQEEISYDKEYLELAQLRFENQFRYEIIGENEIPPDTFIPTMILQPILENSTIHGVKMQGASLLRIEFSFNEPILSCKVTDDGIGYKESMKQKLLAGTKRESKGLILLQKKIESLNTIYNLDLQVLIHDLSENHPQQQGTQVTLTYSPDFIWKHLKK